VIRARCQRCDAVLATAIVSVLSAVLAVWVFRVCWQRNWRRMQYTRRRLVLFVERVSFRAKVRETISFLQINTQLAAVYALHFPAEYTRLLDALSSVVNLHLFVWLPGFHPVCFGLSSLGAQLWFAALAPLGVALAAFPVAKLADQPATAALPFVLGWTFLLYPSIMSRGFRALAPCDAFPYSIDTCSGSLCDGMGDGPCYCDPCPTGCVDAGEVSFLREDYAVECTGSLFGRPSAPSNVLAPAWLVVCLWAAGVPLMYALLLYNATRLRGSLAVLVGDYRRETVAWVLVPVTEKLALVGFLSLLDPGAGTQLLVAVLIAFCGLLLQSQTAPHRRRTDNLFAFVSAAMLVLVLLGSFVLQSEAVAPNLDIDVTVTTAMLFVATLSVTLVAAVFFVCELYAARAPAFQLLETKQPPTLELETGKRWHLFLSHRWDNQDAVAFVKQRLQLLLPGARIFLDVDDLESIDALESYVQESAVVLILLGSTKYFESPHCHREVAAAKTSELPLILLHDSDPVKNGSPLDELRDACPLELREFVFGGDVARPVVPWHRAPDFQLISMKLIAEAVLAPSPPYRDQLRAPHPSLYLPGEISRCALVFLAPVCVWVSESNDGACSLANELISICPALSLVTAPVYLHEMHSEPLCPLQLLPVNDDSAVGAAPAPTDSSASEAAVMLLYLNQRTFSDPRLAEEVRQVWAHGGKVVLVHENDPAKHGCAFGRLFSMTPADLLEANLFGAVAVALHPGEQFRAVSMRLLAMVLGARKVGDKEGGMVELMASLRFRLSGLKSSRLRSVESPKSARVNSPLADEDLAGAAYSI